MIRARPLAVVTGGAIVTVGVEARLGWALHRLLPTRVADRAARASILGL